MTLRLRVPKLARWGVCDGLGFILPRDRVSAAISLVISRSPEEQTAIYGKRGISKAQAKALGEFFKVSPSIFFDR